MIKEGDLFRCACGSIICKNALFLLISQDKIKFVMQVLVVNPFGDEKSTKDKILKKRFI